MDCIFVFNNKKEVICIFRFDCKKLILFIVMSVATSILFTFNASAAVTENDSKDSLEDVSPNVITDGVYNIVNKETGLYLDVYDFAYDTEGRAYLGNKSGKNGQDFLIRCQDDGSYIIYPQSEDGLYSLSYASDIMEGEFLFKQDALSVQSKFFITPEESDGETTYKIKPACMSDDKLALGVSPTISSHKNSLAGLAFDNGCTKQQWEIVKVPSKALTLSGGYIDVKVGGTHPLYAKFTPEYLIGDLTWESSDPDIAYVDENGVVHGVLAGKATITVSCGDVSDSVTINVTNLDAYTWYSQHNSVNGGWNAEKLNSVYLGGVCFFRNGYKTGSDWMDEGCKLCAVAMVLHNMDAVLTEGYDFRSGQENNLAADPYTVGLANSGVYGENKVQNSISNSPNYINHHLIDPRFTVDGKAVQSQMYHGCSLSHIKELLEQHPEGVIVGMYNGYRDTTHYVVFTECLNPDDPYGNYEFRICDSAASDPSLGDNVPFKQSISYKSLGYSYWSINNYTVFNIVE